MITPVVPATARLTLRAFAAADGDDVVAYANDPEFGRYLPLAIPYPYSRSDAEAFIAQSVQWDWGVRPEWAIEFHGPAVGAIALRIEAQQGRASFGYGIGRAHWRQGNTTEASRAVLEWAVSLPGIERVFATADARNAGSWSVMRRLGMRHEATLRMHRVDRFGERADEVLYGVLRGEWPAPRR